MNSNNFFPRNGNRLKFWFTMGTVLGPALKTPFYKGCLSLTHKSNFSETEFLFGGSTRYKRHSTLSKPHSTLKNTLFASELVEISINSTERTPILNSKIHSHNNTHSVPLNSTCLTLYLTPTEMWKFKFQFCSDACCLLVARRWTSFNSFCRFRLYFKRWFEIK